MNIHLFQAIKELDAKLEADLEALEQENDRLRQEIHALEHTH
jgi:cell division protein FtsB